MARKKSVKAGRRDKYVAGGKRANSGACSVDVEQGEVKEPPEYVNYEEARTRFNARMMLFMDAVLDLSNEGTDVALTFDEMQEEAPDLFKVSVGFLIFSAVLRLCVAVRPLFTWNESGAWKPPIKRGWRAWLLFFLGVAFHPLECFLLEIHFP